jgi:hypothetical protein
MAAGYGLGSRFIVPIRPRYGEPSPAYRVNWRFVRG